MWEGYVGMGIGLFVYIWGTGLESEILGVEVY